MPFRMLPPELVCISPSLLRYLLDFVYKSIRLRIERSVVIIVNEDEEVLYIRKMTSNYLPYIALCSSSRLRVPRV